MDLDDSSDELRSRSAWLLQPRGSDDSSKGHGFGGLCHKGGIVPFDFFQWTMTSFLPYHLRSFGLL